MNIYLSFRVTPHCWGFHSGKNLYVNKNTHRFDFFSADVFSSDFLLTINSSMKLHWAANLKLIIYKENYLGRLLNRTKVWKTVESQRKSISLLVLRQLLCHMSQQPPRLSTWRNSAIIILTHYKLHLALIH